MKPLIGITTGEIFNKIEPWAGIVFGQNHKYSDAILAAGGVPVLLPFVPDRELKILYDQLDGVVLAGGNDVDPHLYGEDQRPRTKFVSKERDTLENSLLEWSLQDDKPILCICRGFQILNVHLGGSLYQDLPSELPGSSDHELSSLKEDVTHIAHILKIEESSKFGEIVGSSTIGANTHHHQGIKDIAKNLKPVAWSEDGLVEALEYPAKRYVVGVQCHPESLYKTNTKWAAVFTSFIVAATQSSEE